MFIFRYGKTIQVACVRARARAHARITKKELESIATKDIEKFT